MSSKRTGMFRQSRFVMEQREREPLGHQPFEALKESPTKLPRMLGELLDQPHSLSYELDQFVISLLAQPDERVIRLSVPLLIGKFRADFHRIGSVRRRQKQVHHVMDQCIRLVLGRAAWIVRSLGAQTRVPVTGPCISKDNGVMQVAFHVPLDFNYDLIHARLREHLELHSQNLDQEKFEQSRLAKRMERWLDSPNVLRRMAVPHRQSPHEWTKEEEQFAAKAPRELSAAQERKRKAKKAAELKTPRERIHSLLESRPFVGQPLSESDFEELRKWREHQASLPFVSREDLIADSIAHRNRIESRSEPQGLATAGVNAAGALGRSPASLACSRLLQQMFLRTFK